MKQERLKILEMLEDGKITADEASKLLESLKHAGKQSRWDDDGEDFDFGERVNAFSKNVEEFSREVGAKMNTAFKTMEPKLRAATKVVVEKTANVMGEISRALNESAKNMARDKSCCEEEESCCCGDADEGPKEN